MVITRKIARTPKAGAFAAGTKLVYMAADCIRCARSLHCAQRTKATATPGENCSHDDHHHHQITKLSHSINAIAVMTISDVGQMLVKH
jgi:hypothetical protein